jgi:hypothetical protein
VFHPKASEDSRTTSEASTSGAVYPGSSISSRTSAERSSPLGGAMMDGQRGQTDTERAVG